MAALSLLRLTNDKSFSAHQEILPTWQFVISMESNREGEINFFPDLPSTCVRNSDVDTRRQIASCELVLLLIKLTLMPY